MASFASSLGTPPEGPYMGLVEDESAVILLNVSVTMLNRRTALLQWWPRDAFMHKDIEIVFTPEYSK